MTAESTSQKSASVRLSPEEINELDRKWAAIKAGEPTMAHDDVARWLDTWGTPNFRPWQDQ
jgi:predicted transcriptional regulator